MTNMVDRLMNPSRRVTPEELAEVWFHQTILLRLPGYGVFADRPTVLNKVRGALGRDLMESASAESIGGQPCPWSPPCALDVFFREQTRNGGHGLPKPLVLFAEQAGQDLILGCSVFGFASDWSQVLVDRLVAVARSKVKWRSAAPDLALPKAAVTNIRLVTQERIDFGPAPDGVEIHFLTPVDASGADILEEPYSLLGRLVRRIDGLARWQDAEIILDWQAMDAHWRGLDYDVTDLRRTSVRRHMGRSRDNVDAETVSGVLRVMGDLRPFWPLLVIGQSCHIGRGAVQGLGRYELKAC